MNTIASLPFGLGFANFDAGQYIAVIAIIMPFVMIIVTVVAKTIARTHQERLRCEVMRAAIERGQPIPPEALRRPDDDDDEKCERHSSSPQNDIRAGLICFGVGAGLFLMLGTFSIASFDGLHGLRWVGAIPGFVGIALLVNGLLNKKTAVPVPTARPAAPDTHGGTPS